MEITTNGTEGRHAEWVISDELDSDSELRIELNGSHRWASTYISKEEAALLANALLVGAGISGTFQVLTASQAGVTEDRVRDIVREVLRDTFNN